MSWENNQYRKRERGINLSDREGPGEFPRQQPTNPILECLHLIGTSLQIGLRCRWNWWERWLCSGFKEDRTLISGRGGLKDGDKASRKILWRDKIRPSSLQCPLIAERSRKLTCFQRAWPNNDPISISTMGYQRCTDMSHHPTRSEKPEDQ